MALSDFAPGDVLFLERPLAAIPWPTGYFVLCRRTEGVAVLSLVSQDARGLYALDNPYMISAEDLSALSPTGEKARLQK